MLRISVDERRARLVARHHLAGDAVDPEQAASGVVVLHATDPATVYLSVLARCASASLEDVAAALYERRSLLRLMAMRRTLFVVPRALAPTVHAGAGLEIATTVRKRLLSELRRLPTEPPVPTDPDELASWLQMVEDSVVSTLETLGTATGAQLSTAEPRLRTALLPTTDKAYDLKRNITTQVLTILGAAGRMLRTEPRGAWTSRHHTWQPVSAWWPGGWPELDPAQARRDLVAAYLRSFGPVTETDVVWWTGWTARQTRAALAGLDLTEVELLPGKPPEGSSKEPSMGLVLSDDTAPTGPTAPDPPAATLLPALDPTPMGWKQRDWFLPEDPKPLYDTFGNVGPTIWWGGEVIGGWAVTGEGRVATRLLEDRGAAAVDAVAAAAVALERRIGGATVVPSFPTPLERMLRAGGAAVRQ